MKFSGYILVLIKRLFKPCLLKTTSAMATDDGMRATSVTTLNTSLDEEEVRSKEIKRLRESVSAYKGYLTRAYKEIRFLCSNLGSLSEIALRKSALHDLFARYTAAVQSLLHNVVDLEEQETIASCHRREADEKALFDEEFTKWFTSARQFVFAGSTRVPTPDVIPPEVPREAPPEIPREVPRETPLDASFYARFHARLRPCPLLTFHGIHHASNYPREMLVLWQMDTVRVHRV